MPSAQCALASESEDPAQQRSRATSGQPVGEPDGERGEVSDRSIRVRGRRTTHLSVDRARDLQQRARKAKLMDKVRRDEEDEEEREVEGVGDYGLELVEPERVAK